MARDQAVKLQILSVKHKGLLHAVDTMLSEYASGRAIQEMIERVYHEKISIKAIGKYKNTKWKVYKDKVREQKIFFTAISEIIGENGLTAGVQALLWQALQTMTPPQLINLKKVLNDDTRVELMKKQFALVTQDHRQKMKARRAAEKAGEGEVVEDFEAAQRMVEQAKEIFGIGTTAFPPPAPRFLNAPQEVQPFSK